MSSLDLHRFWTVSENRSCIRLAEKDRQSLHSKKIEESNIIVSYLIGRENVPVFLIKNMQVSVNLSIQSYLFVFI